MRNRWQRIPNPRVALVCVLTCIATAPSVFAAAGGLPAAQPVEELVELDEVQARGKVTANILATAENRVYRLYNKLNKTNRYDVHCGYVYESPDSSFMRRTCAPDFLANYATRIPESFYATPRPQCAGNMTQHFESNGDPYWMSSCNFGYQPGSFAAGSYGAYSPTYYGLDSGPRMQVASLVPEEEKNKFADNVLRVMESDPELFAMAEGLARLYAEMDRIEARYDQLRAEKRAARAADPRSRGFGRHPGR